MAFRKKSDKSEVNLKTQLKKVFVSHLSSLLIIFIVFFFFFLSFWTIKFVDKIMGILMLIVYAISIASSANACASQDKRSCATTKAYPAKGLLLSLPIIISNIFFFILWQILWIIQSNIANITGQLIFVFWSLPYNSFLNLNSMNFNLFGGILMLIVPIISAGAGYLAGYFNWDIYEKLDKIAFEKKNN